MSSKVGWGALIKDLIVGGLAVGAALGAGIVVLGFIYHVTWNTDNSAMAVVEAWRGAWLPISAILIAYCVRVKLDARATIEPLVFVIALPAIAISLFIFF